jgi:hypothetical protein
MFKARSGLPQNWFCENLWEALLELLISCHKKIGDGIRIYWYGGSNFFMMWNQPSFSMGKWLHHSQLHKIETRVPSCPLFIPFDGKMFNIMIKQVAKMVRLGGILVPGGERDHTLV